MTIQAFYIHSWFSWIAFSLISNQLSLNNDQILLILARNFHVPKSDNRFKAIRFEPTEAAINSSVSLHATHQAVDLFFHQSAVVSQISELFIPHIAYFPFAVLASNDKVLSFSFYQESIQFPDDVLVRREAEYLLQNKNPSLYRPDETKLLRKMSKKYYTITDETIPLHLSPVTVNGFEEMISSISSAHLKHFDFAIIAGKAQNHPLGIKFFDEIISIYRHFHPQSKLLLKASPSSSRLLVDWMLSQQCDQITFVPGDVSIESWLVKGQVRVILSELFSLSAIAKKYSPQTKLVSIDKTIINDFPSYSSILTDRIMIKSYYAATMNELSFSQYLISTLSEMKG